MLAYSRASDTILNKSNIIQTPATTPTTGELRETERESMLNTTNQSNLKKS